MAHFEFCDPNKRVWRSASVKGAGPTKINYEESFEGRGLKESVVSVTRASNRDLSWSIELANQPKM